MIKNLHQMRLNMFPKTQLKKTAEPTGDLTGNKIANTMTGISKNLETDTNGHDKEISQEKPKERCIFPDEAKLLIIAI